MTLLLQSCQSGTVGGAISTSNPSGDNTFNQVNTTGNTAIVDTTHTAPYTTGAIKFSPAASTVDSCRWNGFSSTAWAFSVYLWIDTQTTDDTWFVNMTSGGTRMFQLQTSTAGKLRFVDTSGTTPPLWTANNVLPLSQWNRLEGYGTTAASGATAQIAQYAGTSTTASESFSTTTAGTTATAADTIMFGKSNSGAYASPFWMGGFQFQTVATGFLGNYPLGTPAVAAGTTTQPSTASSTDGSQVVSWSAITGATGYDAYTANKASPLQTDFTLFASNVTSPYTFGSLSQGTYSFGIQAKA